MIAHLNEDEQNPAYDLLSTLFKIYLIHMASLIDRTRIDQIIIFLKSLNINSQRFHEMIISKNLETIHNFNEALTHS